MPRRTNFNVDESKGFIWLPRETPFKVDIKIDSESVKTSSISAEFTKALCPEVGSFKIRLINANGAFTDKYSGRETVQLYGDFVDGTTKIFEGQIDIIKDVSESYPMLEVSGGHISDDLMNITVTKEYTGNKTCDQILKEIIDTYLTGYTYTNVLSSTESPTIKWSNKPFWNCVEDLCKLAGVSKRFDCYVDDDKDFHFFEEESVENNNEAVVWNNTLISLSGLGEYQLNVKNKIIVYGDDGKGIPIIRQDSDSTSQSSYGKKESVIVDTSISTEEYAEALASANLLTQKTPTDEGKASCFILPSLNPGEKIWVSYPKMKILKQIKVSQFTHKFPNKMTDVVFYKSKSIAGVIRDQSLKDIANETIVNPYEMTKSINFTFDDFSKLSAWDTNIEIIDGKIKLSSGTVGTFTSKIFTQVANITQVHLLIVGEKTTEAVFKISTDGTTQTLEEVKPNTLHTLTNPGKDILLKVYLNSASTEIDSIGVLIK